jgi:hypothetical protein
VMTPWRFLAPAHSAGRGTSLAVGLGTGSFSACFGLLWFVCAPACGDLTLRFPGGV